MLFCRDAGSDQVIHNSFPVPAEIRPLRNCLETTLQRVLQKGALFATAVLDYMDGSVLRALVV